jgi:hypothetical protein
MNGTNEGPAPVEPSSNSLESLTPQQLAELGANPETLANARAEVCRRLKDTSNKANYLTFRWFLPADDADKADAYYGLIGCCWNATEIRNRSGLFPRGYPDTFCGARNGRRGSIAQSTGAVAGETRESIMDALADCLYDLRTLPVPEVILTALNGGFHIDADVGNALRRRVREESKYLFQYGHDVVSGDDDGEVLTLFEILPDESDGTDCYGDAIEIILQEKAQVVEEFGEEGWEVLEQIVDFIDNDLLPQRKRDRQRLVTEVFERAYRVNPRQARTHKSRFLARVETAAIERKAVFEAIAQLLDWLGCWDGENS